MKFRYYIFVFLVIFSSCKNSESSNTKDEDVKEDVTENNVDNKTNQISKDGFELTVAEGIQFAEDETNSGEILFLTNDEHKISLQVFKTEKELFYGDLTVEQKNQENQDWLPEFHSSFLEQTIAHWEEKKFVIKSEFNTKKILIQDAKTIETVFMMDLQGTEYNYAFLSIDGADHFYTIICWSPTSASDEINKAIMQTLNSIKVL